MSEKKENTDKKEADTKSSEANKDTMSTNCATPIGKGWYIVI